MIKDYFCCPICGRCVQKDNNYMDDLSVASLLQCLLGNEELIAYCSQCGFSEGKSKTTFFIFSVTDLEGNQIINDEIKNIINKNVKISFSSCSLDKSLSIWYNNGTEVIKTPTIKKVLTFGNTVTFFTDAIMYSGYINKV